MAVPVAYVAALILMVTSTTYGGMDQNTPLKVSPPITQAIRNPLSVMFVGEPHDVVTQFGLEVLEMFHQLKEWCQISSIHQESHFQDQINHINQFKEQVMGRLDITSEERDGVMGGIDHGMKQLLMKQDEDRHGLIDNCTQRYHEIINEQMELALTHVKGLLAKDGGMKDYVKYVNRVSQYNVNMKNKLNECLSKYGPAYNGQSVDICMGIEIQSLIEFTDQFIIEATQYMHHRLKPSVASTSATPTPMSPPSNGNHRKHHHGNHHHHGHHPGHHHNGTNHHGNHHNDHHGNHHNDHHGNHHNHHDHGNHHNHHGNDHHHGNHHNNHHGNHNNHHGHHNGTNHHGNHHNDHHGNHHNNHHGNHHNNHHGNHNNHHGHHNGTNHHGNHHHHNNHHDEIFIDPPTKGHPVKSHRTMTIILITGSISIGLVLGILVVTLVIIILKCHRSKKTSSKWINLSEEEKIAKMKESGYANPTYQYFDQVTQ